MSPRRRHDEEVEAEEEEEVTTRRRRPKRAKFFGESGLTDSERREIRQTQRALQQDLCDGKYFSVEELSEARQSNNGIFEDKVRYTRECALTPKEGILFACACLLADIDAPCSLFQL
jgi:hypothetical protein